jgi:hypothetical protein
MAGSCELGNEYFGIVKCVEFLSSAEYLLACEEELFFMK